MNNKISNIAIITIGIVLATMANIFIISPNKAGADSVILKKAICDPSDSKDIYGTSNNTAPGDVSEFTKVRFSVRVTFIKADGNWAQCPTGYLLHGVWFEKEDGGSGSSDGFYLHGTCCKLKS